MSEKPETGVAGEASASEASALGSAATALRGPWRRILVVGSNIPLPDDVVALYKEEGTLLVGNGKDELKLEEINDKIGKGGIGPKTIVSIYGHGLASNGVHTISIGNAFGVKTSSLFSALGELAEPISPSTPDSLSPLNIHLFSCYGGAAAPYVRYLPVGSVVAAHAPDNDSSLQRNGHLAIKNLAQVSDGRALHDILMNFEMQNLTVGVKLNDNSTTCLTLRPPELDLALPESVKTFLDARSETTRKHFEAIAPQLLPSTIDVTHIPSKYETDGIVDIGMDEHQKNLVLTKLSFAKEADDYNKIAQFLKTTEKEPSFFDYKEGSLLLIASGHSSPSKLEVMKILLERGGDPDTRNGEKTLLDKAKSKEEALLLLKHKANLSLETLKRIKSLEIDPKTLLDFAKEPDVIKALVLAGEATQEKHGPQLKILIDSTKDPATGKSPFEEHGVMEAILAAGEDSTGKSPLHFAKTAADVKALIALGANVNAIDHECRTPLLAASSQEVLAALIEAGASRNVTDSRDRNALHFAKTTADVEAFIKAGVDVNARAKNGGAPIHTAANFDVLKALIEGGAEPTAIYSRRTALHNAKSPEAVELLVQKGVSVNEKDANDASPIFYAKSAEVIEALKKCGADPNIKNQSGMTAIACAESAEIVRALVRVGADPNIKDNLGATPIFNAKNAEVARVLIEEGVDPKAISLYGDPLSCYPKPDVIKVLVIAGGADPAKKEHADEIEKLLEDGGMKKLFAISGVAEAIHAAGKDTTGKAPLHFAATPESAQALLDAGAFVFAKDYDGKMPLDIARERGDTAVIDFLTTETSKALEARALEEAALRVVAVRATEGAAPPGGAASGHRGGVPEAGVAASASSAADAMRRGLSERPALSPESSRPASPGGAAASKGTGHGMARE